MPDKSNVVNINALDATSFRVPACDAKGHSVPKSFRIMPVLANAIQIIISSHEFPYKTDSELIRHALVRHIRWLESIGEIPSVSGQVDAANEVLKEDQMYEEYQEIFNSLRARISDYVRREDHQQARSLVMKFSGHINRMPNGYWKSQYERQLKEWDWLFESAPRIKFGSVINE